jgi:hypothetical protein
MPSSPARTATLVAVPVALLAGVLAFWALGGFPGAAGDPGASGSPSVPAVQASGPVSVAAQPLDEHTATVCRAVMAKLPASVRDRARRPVTIGSEQTTAYGDPPIVIACGVKAPAVRQEDFVVRLSGVCWFPEEHNDGQIWTTVDREVPVRVTVPKAYDQPSQWVVSFSATVGETVDTTATTTSGCADQVGPSPSPR